MFTQWYFFSNFYWNFFNFKSSPIRPDLLCVYALHRSLLRVCTHNLCINASSVCNDFIKCVPHDILVIQAADQLYLTHDRPVELSTLWIQRNPFQSVKAVVLLISYLQKKKRHKWNNNKDLNWMAYELTCGVLLYFSTRFKDFQHLSYSIFPHEVVDITHSRSMAIACHIWKVCGLILHKATEFLLTKLVIRQKKPDYFIAGHYRSSVLSPMSVPSQEISNLKSCLRRPHVCSHRPKRPCLL